MRIKDPFKQYKEYGIPLWQCPPFLFLIMGIVIIFSMVFVYAIGTRLLNDPYLINLIILGITAALLIIAFIITNSFERLAEANRLKSEFVSIVSHQLRAPLSNFIWALDFLMTGERSGKDITGYFNILKENASRMRNLVNDLLAVSRIQSGKLPFDKQEFSFTELVGQVVDEFRPMVQAANIRLRIEGAKDLPLVRSDPNRLKEVIANFVDNAIRYAWKEEDAKERRGEEKQVIVRFRTQDKQVRFEVEDNGLGISAEDQRFIFEKFFRSERARRHETHGSGLGLYIAKSIIQRAGGIMGFNSKENQGSTFWFSIPIS
ncbi:HAMP domain-containing histidine kinase [Patescibacteria group bacterium]|nr:HAMP domain-containing histidine kinase [Patescibacteria group bacterium]